MLTSTCLACHVYLILQITWQKSLIFKDSNRTNLWNVYLLHCLYKCYNSHIKKIIETFYSAFLLYTLNIKFNQFLFNSNHYQSPCILECTTECVQYLTIPLHVTSFQWVLFVKYLSFIFSQTLLRHLEIRFILN